MKEIFIFIGMWIGILFIGLIVSKLDKGKTKMDWYE